MTSKRAFVVWVAWSDDESGVDDVDEVAVEAETEAAAIMLPTAIHADNSSDYSCCRVRGVLIETPALREYAMCGGCVFPP